MLSYKFQQPDPGNLNIAILSVYDKTGLLDLAKGLIHHNVRLLASGGTAKKIREAGLKVECVKLLFFHRETSIFY